MKHGLKDFDLFLKENVRNRMNHKILEHEVIYKEKDFYCSFPILNLNEEGIFIGFFKAPMVDHYGIFSWEVMKKGQYGWSHVLQKFSSILQLPGLNPREKSDRFVIDKGKNIIAYGSPGFRSISPESKEERLWYLEKCKLIIDKGLMWEVTLKDRKIFVCNNNMILNRVIKITEPNTIVKYNIEGVKQIITFPRGITLKKGIYLVPGYGVLENGKSLNFVFSSEDGINWDITQMFNNPYINGNEMALIEIDDGVIYALIRKEAGPYLMQASSFDSGKTWCYPTRTNINGFPPHLLKLKNGKILCTYGYRGSDEMGIRAVITDMKGEYPINWSDPIILRNDGGYHSSLHKVSLKDKLKKDYFNYAWNDVGYPVSTQLDNGDILTVYYITTKDQITHIASTLWRLDE